MSTVEVAPHGPRPPIRLRRAPRCEPPYDDELEPQWWVTANQLALDWSTPAVSGGPASESGLAPRSGGVHGSGGVQDADGMHGFADRSGVAVGRAGATAGEAKLAVRRFVQICVEVLNGYRPPAHLRRLALPQSAAAIVEQAIEGTGRVAQIRHAGQSERRARAAARRERGPGPVAVLRLQLSHPRPGAVETTILLVTGERTWAMALRMELHQETWAATTLRLV